MINLYLYYPISKYWALISFFVFCLNYSQGQCVGNLLNNGSFTSFTGENVTATGWTGSVTPDINDAIGPLFTSVGYSWTGTPIASPDGNTWQNLFYGESVQQTVNVTPGQWYKLQFEYAAQGIYGPGYTFNGPTGVLVYLNGVLVYTTPDDSTQYTWEYTCFSFLATNSPITIDFRSSQYEYVGIDGACILPNTNNSINLGNDTILCQGASLTLNATTSNATYLWQDNSINSTFTVTQQGTYWVKVNNNNCTIITDTINVSYNPLPTVNLGNDTNLCQGTNLTLNATASNATYLWQDNSTNPTYTITQKGIYWAEVTNNCGTYFDTLIVEDRNCNCTFYIPNAFTPNKNNLNDRFSPVSDCNFSEYHFMIFNRWGEKIFETNNYIDSWDGTYSGEIAPIGVYVYLVTYAFEKEIGKRKYGNVNLIR